MGVSGNRIFSCGGRQKFVHLSNAPNLITRGVDGEDEDKDDCKEHCSVGAVFAETLDHFGCDLAKIGNILVTEEGCSHTTDNDVDGHTDRDQETSCDRVHPREVSDGRGTAQDKHGRDDNVRGQSKKSPLKVELWEYSRGSYPKNMKTKWAVFPQRVPMISSQV